MGAYSILRMLTAGLVALGSCAVIAACGGGSSTTVSTQSGPALPERDISALDKADLAIFASANSTAKLVRNPNAVDRARRLLKPLLVANTLNVKPSNEVAGPLVANLSSELDAVAPGLTTGNGSNEHLDTPTVHRFLEFGRKDPTEVFRPRVEQGITELDRLLHGKPAAMRVTAAGVTPPQTARALVIQDVGITRPYWPDLAKRLEALGNSLR